MHWKKIGSMLKQSQLVVLTLSKCCIIISGYKSHQLLTLASVIKCAPQRICLAVELLISFRNPHCYHVINVVLTVSQSVMVYEIPQGKISHHYPNTNAQQLESGCLAQKNEIQLTLSLRWCFQIWLCVLIEWIQNIVLN